LNYPNYFIDYLIIISVSGVYALRGKKERKKEEKKSCPSNRLSKPTAG
jgi:hypothetical protein